MHPGQRPREAQASRRARTHMSLFVSDTERSASWFADVLDMRITARGPQWVFLSFGRKHHDLALIQAADGARQGGLGLQHYGLEIEGDLDELRRLYGHAAEQGRAGREDTDHKVGFGLYFTTRTATASSSSAKPSPTTRKAARPRRHNAPSEARRLDPSTRDGATPWHHLGPYHVRKWSLHGRTCSPTRPAARRRRPLCRIVIAAAIRNPYAGGYSGPGRDRRPSGCWARVRPPIVAAAGDGADRRATARRAWSACRRVRARQRVPHPDVRRPGARGGRRRLSWVPSTGKVGGPGSRIDIPLAHKDALYVRSHYDTVTVTFGDAPRPDEVVVAFAVATRGRLHARLGGLRADQVAGRDGLR
jgi:catechol 2,3-dioxygenase-like lactoylglutathione lyase family enzyme